MSPDSLRALQSPLKDSYKRDPTSAQLTLQAAASLDGFTVSCTVPTHVGAVQAGLHPAAGGDGSLACAGTMLLEALVACAGVTLEAVATNMGIPTLKGMISAEGDLDMRGTLGVDRETPVGFTAIRLKFDLPSVIEPAQRDKLIKLTERYCVVYQTLKRTPSIESSIQASATSSGQSA